MGVLLLSLNPVNSKLINLAFLVCAITAWIGLTALTWKFNKFRIALLVAPFLVIIPFALPGFEIDSAELRTDYLKTILEFEGTEYHWGGENSRGIDCSGLPRRALRNALLKYGVRHANGRAFRTYLEHWWFDASAQALAEGYRNYTTPIHIIGTINTIDYDILAPGDMAVTTTGVHVVVYAGDGKWIQADPGVGTVSLHDGQNSENTWLFMPITMHRWQILSQP